MGDLAALIVPLLFATFVLASWGEVFCWWRMVGWYYRLVARWSSPVGDILIPGLTVERLRGMQGESDEVTYRFDEASGVLVLRKRIKIQLGRRRASPGCMMIPVQEGSALRLQTRWALAPLIPLLSVPVVGLLIGLASVSQGEPGGLIFTVITWVMGGIAITGNFVFLKRATPPLFEEMGQILRDHAAATATW